MAEDYCRINHFDCSKGQEVLFFQAISVMYILSVELPPFVSWTNGKARDLGI